VYAYVVISHHKPELVSRLLHRLRELSPEAQLVLRHDQQITPAPSDLPSGVHLGGDSPLTWGHWNIVEATLHELAWVVTHTDASHAVVISGQDYPVRPLSDWERSVAHLDGVMEAKLLQFKAPWGRGPVDGDETLIRYSYRWYAIPGSHRWDQSGSFVKLMDRTVARLMLYIRPLAYYRIPTVGRDTMVGVRRSWQRPTYKGSQWMMLSRRAIHHVLAQDLTPYRRTLIPDEAAIHSAVLTNPDLRVRLADLTYTRWGRLEHPDEVSWEDLDAIHASGAPFTRKVELSPFLDALDRLSDGQSISGLPSA